MSSVLDDRSCQMVGTSKVNHRSLTNALAYVANSMVMGRIFRNNVGDNT